MQLAPHKGFALLISVILTSVVLAIGLALLDVAYKQVLLSTNAKQSALAFYNADSAMECALYNDQKLDAFNPLAPLPQASVLCRGVAISGYQATTVATTRTTKFDIPCASGGVSGSVTVIKSLLSSATSIFTTGYNTCTVTSPIRVERGLKIKY